LPDIESRTHVFLNIDEITKFALLSIVLELANGFDEAVYSTGMALSAGKLVVMPSGVFIHYPGSARTILIPTCGVPLYVVNSSTTQV
jgi:hypothetical protein